MHDGRTAAPRPNGQALRPGNAARAYARADADTGPSGLRADRGAGFIPPRVKLAYFRKASSPGEAFRLLLAKKKRLPKQPLINKSR